jgi:hypothetical protein
MFHEQSELMAIVSYGFNEYSYESLGESNQVEDGLAELRNWIYFLS